MGAYLKDIREFERQRLALKQALDDAFRLRDHSPRNHRDWKDAAAGFANQWSVLNPLLARCYRASPRPVSPELRAFMFDYMAVDPQFYRSGYMMERIVRKVKALKLSRDEMRIIRNLILNRIETKAFRNFRDICRLIPMLQDRTLRAEIEGLAHSSDAGVRHRARFALAYFGP